MNEIATKDTMTVNHRYPLEFSIPAWRSFIEGIPMMLFQASEGRPGFCIDLLNDYSLLVQFGCSNYCGNINNKELEQRMWRGDKNYDDVVCPTAETAVIFQGELVDYQGDQVQGYQTNQNVIDTLFYLSGLTTEPKKYLSAKEIVDDTVYEAEIVDEG